MNHHGSKPGRACVLEELKISRDKCGGKISRCWTGAHGGGASGRCSEGSSSPRIVHSVLLGAGVPERGRIQNGSGGSSRRRAEFGQGEKGWPVPTWPGLVAGK